MININSKSTSTAVPGYHSVTRWLHAGLVLGVLFQLGCTAWMAHPAHQDGGHASASMEQSMHGSQKDHPSNIAVAVDDNHEKSSWRQGLMQAHRIAGLLVALIVLANLVWALKLRGDPPHRQIGVLFSPAHWRKAGAIVVRLPQMLVGHQPLVNPGNSLSLVIEMLGLLVVTVMALTGGVIWGLWSGPGATVLHNAETLMAIHSFFATLLMLYLAGHVSMALIHAWSGDRVFVRISPFGKSQ